jgi:energy-coupling factor transport system ATP-binding protein
MAWIEVKGFSYTYPGETVPTLQAVDLSLEKGAFSVLTGRSGCGKSTLGKALAGFLFADPDPKYAGKIIVNGFNMAEIPLYQASERVAYVQQNPEDQFCTLTVQDEVAFGLENLCLNPINIEQRIDTALQIVKGIDLKARELHTLSGGEKQKVAMASMLALKPDVLILDEPTSNLDPIATQNIFESLYHLRQVEEMTVIIIEHKLDQLLGLDPIFFSLDEGKITEGYHQPKLSPSDRRPILANPAQLLTNDKGRHSEKAPFVQMRNASVEIEGHEILHNINLSLNAGEFIAVMGANGSGKSTLLRTIMGFHRLTRGSSHLFGKSSDSLKVSDLVPELGFVFQNPDHQLFTQSVWEEITLTGKNLGQISESFEQKAKQWLDHIGLENRMIDHPQKLCYGEKRRLNLAAILLHNPQLLLIDELLIGQDPTNANLWMGFLKAITEIGYSILLVIHQPWLTLKYCDRLIFLEEGKIIIDEEVASAFESLLKMGYHAFLPNDPSEKVYA